MKQQELPFPDENFGPGWTGKRYLLCSDGQWHLVLAVHAGLVADTQCCEDVRLVVPVPDGDTSPTCKTCVSLHFPPAK